MRVCEQLSGGVGGVFSSGISVYIFYIFYNLHLKSVGVMTVCVFTLLYSWS